jgi:hypothetical protein
VQVTEILEALVVNALEAMNAVKLADPHRPPRR